MSTASAYINKIRVESTVRNNKVEYPGKVAKNIEPLAATCSTNPSFTVLSYTKAHSYCGLRIHGCINK
jgi:hypothetical protein